MEKIPDPNASPAAPSAEDQPAVYRSSPHRRLIATLRTPWARMLTTTLIVLAALAYILGRSLPGGLGNLPVHLFAPASTGVVAATITPTPTPTPIIPTPKPATGLLGSPPLDCPAAVPLASITAQPAGFSEQVQLFGRSPV